MSMIDWEVQRYLERSPTSCVSAADVAEEVQTYLDWSEATDEEVDAAISEAVRIVSGKASPEELS